MGLAMTKTVGICFWLLAAFAAGGCYNTSKVQNGDLVCGPNHACPDGFQCICLDGAPCSKTSSEAGHCWRNGTGPDAGGTGADTAKPDAAVPLACTLVGAMPPFGPFPADRCSPVDQPAPGTCDPVCQAGCSCDRRCVLASTYDRFQCEASAQAPSSFVDVQKPCTGNLSGSCVPGSVCIADDVCPWLCFRTCRKDLDCGAGSRCSVLTVMDQNAKPVPNVSLCTPPIESCSPAGTASCVTARPEFACVFLAGMTGILTTDQAVCDCKTTHTVPVGSLCSMLPDDCQAGAVCVDGTCRQICDRQAAGTACPGAGVCNPVYNSTRFGYCTR
jgi:hypothetical protein